MTLILSRISQNFVLQVADRLVTHNGRPFDSLANKSILLVSEGGIVALSFTGIAFIAGIPTDQWIVQALTGKQFSENERPSMFSTGNSFGGKTFHRLLIDLTNELTKVFTSRIMSPHQGSYLEVMISGWQWSRRKRPRPINISIERVGRSSSFIQTHSRRHLGKNFLCFLAPKGNKIFIDRNKLNQRIIAASSIEESEQAFIEAIRFAAKQSSIIGPNCVSICILPPWRGGTSVRYQGDLVRARMLSKKTEESLTELSVGFSPWIIGPALIAAPSLMNGPSTISVGGYEVKLDPSQGLQIASSQRRPTWKP